MSRASRFEGWAPFFTGGGFARAARTAEIETPEQLAEAVRFVRSCRPDAGSDAPFDVCWSDPMLGDPRVSVDERRGRLTALEKAGVTWLATTIPGESRAELLAGAAAFGREIIAGRR
jgi:hypothetical protein